MNSQHKYLASRADNKLTLFIVQSATRTSAMASLMQSSRILPCSFGDARRQHSEAQSRQKQGTQRNQAMVVEYDSLRFLAIRLTNRFKNTFLSGAMPALVVHTNVVKLSCSTSRTHCPYSERFLCSCRL